MTTIARTDPPFVARRLPVMKLAIAAVVIALALLDRAGLLLVRPHDDFSRYDGAVVQVVDVIDGDTVDVDRPDARADLPATRVRLWGVDAPPRDGAEPGELATRRARSLAMRRSVTLALEPHRTRCRHGRLVAHVFLPDGTSLAERLVEEGLARTDERWPHARLDELARAERTARRRGAGIWAPSSPAPPCDAPPDVAAAAAP